MRALLTKRVRGNTSAAVKVEVMDARFPKLPFGDGEFDAVVCFMVLSHVHQREEAVREACRVLKVGGKILLMDHGAHDHGDGHGHGHGAQGHGPSPFFWFKEWVRFVFVHSRLEMNIELLLEPFRKEDRWREEFVSRMQVKKGFVVNFCYGCFTRVK